MEVNSNKHLDSLLMELKESVLSELNQSFSQGGNGVLRYQGRLYITNVEDLINQILEKAHGSCNSIHSGATKMYHDLREVYWWDSF